MMGGIGVYRIERNLRPPVPGWDGNLEARVGESFPVTVNMRWHSEVAIAKPFFVAGKGESRIL